MTHRLRTRVALVLIAALVLVAAVAAACSAQASGERSDGAGGTASNGATMAPSDDGSVGTATGAKGAVSDDWSRVAQALAWMRAEPPAVPVVVLLGGSSARESTISDGSWRAQIVAKGGPSVLAWNMGSHNRTMAQNLAIVKALPAGADALVFVGVNLGSFTSAQKAASIALPSPAPAGSEISLEQPHQYSTQAGILSTSKKKAAVQQWLSRRYPVYKANFATNAAILEQLIKVCKNRGYKVVLFELPRNTQVIGSALAAPTRKYREKCAVLHARYDVPWVSLVSAARIPNSSFYDLWHLVEPGRKVWQGLLSARTATLLKQYGFDGGGS